MKLKVYKKPYRQYKDKAIEIFQEHGMLRMQEYCVVSQLELAAVYSLVLEEIEDEELKVCLQNVIDFYDCEVIE